MKIVFANDKKISTFAPQFSKLKRVDNLKDFIIPFRGLSLGVHKYDWEIGKKFFESIENTEIQDANITVSLELEKQERLMILNFSIEGEMVVLCDRCLDDLKLTITTKEAFYIKIGDVEMGMEEAENILVIPETEYKIDIGLLVNEFITLSLPLKKVHGEDENGISECNPETLKKLEELSTKNKIDPRWDKLKNIKLD